MAMPEAAMHEDGELPTLVGEVRCTGQPTDVATTANAELAQDFGNRLFRCRATASHLFHERRATWIGLHFEPYNIEG